MSEMSPQEQRHRLSSLISDITKDHGEEVAHVARAEASLLSVEQAMFLLDLVASGGVGVTARAVEDLAGLGYADAHQVLRVSRLIRASGHRMTVPTITLLGLSRIRSEVLLDVSPRDLRLLSAADDKAWRRAMVGLPGADLRECISTAVSGVDLWMSVVSAQDPHMARRIREFTEAGLPYVPWITSGHSLAALRAQMPRRQRRLSRLEIHGAVRALDRGQEEQVSRERE